MQTVRSAASMYLEKRKNAMHTWVLLTVAALAVLTAGCGDLLSPMPQASATSSTRQLLTKAVTGQTTKSPGPAATSAPRVPPDPTVDLFGDSLGYQAEPYLDMFFREAGDYNVSNNTFGGTATCDWLSRMAAAAARRPRAAILVFSGNAFTPCMEGVAPRSPEYFNMYATYTEQAIATFSAVGSHVFLVGTPIAQSSVAGWDRLDHIYQRLAHSSPLRVTYVDAGAAVESSSRGFTWHLRCMNIEPSCGANGTNVVRSPDGVHFCPDGTPSTRGVTGPCDEYSSGAFRFALAIVKTVSQFPHRRSASVIRRLTFSAVAFDA